MQNSETVIFGGGCFWCTEAIFKSLKGVQTVVPGYAGGREEDADYQKVSQGHTSHVESIKIEYNPTIISFGDLLSVFFNTHDPTTLNKQGADVGTQYASAIFYTTEAQKKEALDLIEELEKVKAYDKPIVTTVKPLEGFFEAEDYHKNYYENNPEATYCQVVIAPKLEKLNKRFANLLK